MSQKNLNLGFLASRILDVPLMITQSKLDQILYVVSDRIGLDKTLLVSPTMPVQARNSNSDYAVNKGVAIIPIHGTLVHRAYGLSALSGISTYESIRAQLDSALTSPDIDSILLDIDSPGGEVAGVFDLADHIYASRNRKPITAAINERGYSAAFAIASSASAIYMTRTAGVGSVGVIMLHVDRSKANEKAGITYTPIYAGDRKIDGSPNSPLSDKARADAQGVVDTVYSLFVSTAARNLNVSESVIRNTQAGTYHGQAAIDIGLAHKILPYQEVVNNLITTKGGIRTKMAKEDVKPVVKTIETQTQLEAVAPDAGTASADPHTTLLAQDPARSILPKPITISAFDKLAVDSAIAQERERCINIMSACGIANVKDSAIDFISNGSTLESTQTMIMTLLAERSKAQAVVSAVNPQKSGATNPLLAEVRRRAEKAKTRQSY